MFLIILSIIINASYSMVMIQIPSEAVVNKSTAIVHGKVINKTSQREQGGIIYTYYTFKLMNNGNIKNSDVAETITIKTIGGKVGKEILEVVGFPVLMNDSEYILFLKERDNINYDIYGANQGCMRAFVESVSGKKQKMLRPCENKYFNAVYLEQVGLELAPKKPVELNEFIKKVKSYQAK
jgi:hypothetical protein